MAAKHNTRTSARGMATAVSLSTNCAGLIYHPISPNVLYARTDVGGAYRWNQASSSWTPMTDGVGFGADSVGLAFKGVLPSANALLAEFVNYVKR